MNPFLRLNKNSLQELKKADISWMSNKKSYLSNKRVIWRSNFGQIFLFLHFCLKPLTKVAFQFEVFKYSGAKILL